MLNGVVRGPRFLAPFFAAMSTGKSVAHSGGLIEFLSKAQESASSLVTSSLSHTLPPPHVLVNAPSLLGRLGLAAHLRRRHLRTINFRYIGNEAGDADSLVSPLCYAYLRASQASQASQSSPSHTHVPLLSVERGDLALRPETQARAGRAPWRASLPLCSPLPPSLVRPPSSIAWCSPCHPRNPRAAGAVCPCGAPRGPRGGRRSPPLLQRRGHAPLGRRRRRR